MDAVVIGAGTGGTVTGIGRKVKERNPKIRVIAVEPEGSTLGNEDWEWKPYRVEGIGKDYVPRALDKKAIDEWIQITDKETFNMARELNKKEGLLSGGSSGAVVSAALKFAKREK